MCFVKSFFYKDYGSHVYGFLYLSIIIHRCIFVLLFSHLKPNQNLLLRFFFVFNLELECR